MDTNEQFKLITESISNGQFKQAYEYMQEFKLSIMDVYNCTDINEYELAKLANIIIISLEK